MAGWRHRLGVRRERRVRVALADPLIATHGPRDGIAARPDADRPGRRASRGGRASNVTTPRPTAPAPKASGRRSASRQLPSQAAVPAARASPGRGRRGGDQARRPGRSAGVAAGSRRGRVRSSACRGGVRRLDARARPRAGPARAGRAGSGAGRRRLPALGRATGEEPAEPGHLEHGQGDQERRRAAPAAAHGLTGSARSARGRTPPRRCPAASLLVGRPPATSRIRSNIRRPTDSTGSPSRIVPASRSMSSAIRSYIGVLVATLTQGVGFRPSTLPRPVVKTRTLAPPATSPVVQGGSYPGVSMNTRPGVSTPLGVADHVDQGGRARLGQRPERLLVDGGQAAVLVARARGCC